MKTFYFSGYWEEPWECGDGCCSGGGDYYIDFTHMVEGDKTYDHLCFSFGTCYDKEGVLLSVYEMLFDEDVPDVVFEMKENEAMRWLAQKLEERDVFVVIDIDG
jgi:hypothetical protein